MTETGKGKMKENRHAITIRTVFRKKADAVSGSAASSLFPIGMVKRLVVLMQMIISFFAVQAFGYQEQTPEREKPNTALTEEEKEMLKDREMLENLALLKNLDTIEFMDLLNEMDPDWSEKDEAVLPEATAEEKEEGQKP